MPKKRFLPVAAMEKVLKQAGADRISEGAKEALCEAVEEIGEKIAKKAIVYASHAGRKTIKKQDITLSQS